MRVAIAGAGIYGASIAIRLSELGHKPELFDPLGLIQAASAINQYRVHAGYHYPRSEETIEEIQEARSDFLQHYGSAVVRGSRNYYAIPHQGSLTSPETFEAVMARHRLALRACCPAWIDFGFIQRVYEVDESVYDEAKLRALVAGRLAALGIPLLQKRFRDEDREGYDQIVWATYGLHDSQHLFRQAKFQVAEKVLIRLPDTLRGVALVVVDGPFTAFDPYGESGYSVFGSARHTNHWSSKDPAVPVPQKYSALLNRPRFEPVGFTHFEAMRADCMLSVPAARDARYLGSRFTLRVVEDDIISDRRTLSVLRSSPHDIHIFSGKVVSAIKAANIVGEMLA